jgi:hypothetical protein
MWSPYKGNQPTRLRRTRPQRDEDERDEDERDERESRQVNNKMMAIQEDQDGDIWSTTYGLYTVTR